MNHLLRELAPITPAGWAEIEREAARTLKTNLAARKLVDFKGPSGWATSSVSTGRTAEIKGPEGLADVAAKIRQVLPLVEFRVPFDVPRAELSAIDRGAPDANMDPVREAARMIARAEDKMVFHGYPAAGVKGICELQARERVPIAPDYEDYPNAVALALTKLHDQGVDGPMAIALGERCYTGLTRTTKGGYPVLEHVRRLVDGPIVWAPAVDGAVVMSVRGEDFELNVGQDFSIGYISHDADTVRLYIQESATFRVLTQEAAIPLVYGSKK